MCQGASNADIEDFVYSGVYREWLRQGPHVSEVDVI